MITFPFLLKNLIPGNPVTSPFSLFSNDVRPMQNSKVKITDYNLENPEVFNLSGVNLIAANDFKILGPDIDRRYH